MATLKSGGFRLRNRDRSRPDRAPRARGVLWAVGLGLAAALYTAGVPGNTLPFHIDESSIAYNAYTLSQSGIDEFGEPWPLYFTAFGEFKNPPFIYLLAGLFKIFGPSIVVARLLSGILGLFSVILIGLLTARLCREPGVGILVALSGLLTPWLFEISRLVFEVAMYPLIMAAFLAVLYRSSTRATWSLLDSAGLAVGLALLTYTYSIGRLLAPLLALGLVVFGGRQRWTGIIRTWLLYVITLLPLFAFMWTHPGALSARASHLMYITTTSTGSEIAAAFIRRYLADVSPRNLLVVGDSNLDVHVPGTGSLLVATAILAIAGLVLVVRRHWRDPWWQFILYGLAVSIVPGALTKGEFHSLRLVAFPVFVLVLTGPAWARLLEVNGRQVVRRVALGLMIGLTLLQGAVFQWRYYRVGLTRDFDVGYLKVFDAVTRIPPPSIYLLVGPGHLAYIHAYWYGTLRGMDTSQFHRVVRGTPLPAGTLVIGELVDSACTQCALIMLEGPFGAYRAL